MGRVGRQDLDRARIQGTFGDPHKPKWWWALMFALQKMGFEVLAQSLKHSVCNQACAWAIFLSDYEPKKKALTLLS